VLFEYLSQRGCGLFQGFLFGRPSSAAEFERQCLALTVAAQAGI